MSLSKSLLFYDTILSVCRGRRGAAFILLVWCSNFAVKSIAVRTLEVRRSLCCYVAMCLIVITLIVMLLKSLIDNLIALLLIHDIS